LTSARILTAKALADALEAPFAISSTGLPFPTESDWNASWKHLEKLLPKPTLDDMRKMGLWWAQGGAALCRKQKFNYLSDAKRMVEWLDASRKWDGQSDPSPKDPRARSTGGSEPIRPIFQPYNQTEQYRESVEYQERINRMTPEEREEDAKKARKIMEEAGF
jgi:hypothetical protein